MSLRIGVTGSKGRLGSWLTQEESCIPLPCDIRNEKATKKAIESVSPDVIINCAAWTDVDGAEDGRRYKRVMDVNLRGPANVRRAFDGLLIHISTGFVFDGTDGPNKEEDLAGPVNTYGWSKFGGERAALMRQPTVVVRVLDLFGPGPKTDFVRQVRDLLELGAEKELPDNLYGTPTNITHLSEALLDIVQRCGGHGKSFARPDLLHIAGDTTLSRFEWGQVIAEHFGHDPNLIKPTSKIKGVAPRPLRGGLNTDKAKSLGIPIYSPAEGLVALSEWESSRGESES
ncbi:MAG: dTDP-4-dehydrorhamnose reductase [Chlamydiae bacterium]|nr:dTDP-4-dehydrorhamnose reductase [Chlamydiota bacterium]